MANLLPNLLKWTTALFRAAYPSMYSMVFNGFNVFNPCTQWEVIDEHTLRCAQDNFCQVAMGSGRQGANTATPPNPLLLVGGETAGLTKMKASSMAVRRYLPAYKRKEKRHHA